MRMPIRSPHPSSELHVLSYTSIETIQTYLSTSGHVHADSLGIQPVTGTERGHTGSFAEQDDAELVDAMAAGDADALEELYERYSRPVFSFALRMMGDRMLAEELLQEVFFRAWNQGHRFSNRRGTFITWLLSITHNMAIDEIRKQNRRPKRADSANPALLLDNITDDGPSVEDQAVMQTVRDQIMTAMALLPENQRSPIELAYFQGLTQREISDRQNEPLGTIKTRMRLAIRKLREHLNDQGVNQL